MKTPPTTPAARESAGPRPLERLTTLQYANTIRDLVGIDLSGRDLFAADIVGASGFASASTISTVDADALVRVGGEVAATAAQDVARLAPCPAGTGDDACARAFVERFGRRAYRRPLADGEVADLIAHYRKGRSELALDHAGGVRMLLHTMLLSPNFLFRWEVPVGRPDLTAGLVRMDPHEMASRLSYFLWSSMPDEPLFRAAETNKLRTPDEVATQARRMLADPRARATIAEFHQHWLEIGDVPNAVKSTTLFKDASPSLMRAMLTETVTFADHVFRDGGDGKLETLLTASFSFVDASLARVYGVSRTGAGVGRVALDPAQRAGILTQPAFLAQHATPAESHPVKRGVALWSKIVCGALPPMPDDIPEPKPAAPNLSTRERFAEHSSAACARGCHALIDPLGFALENYDALGRFRTVDGGKPVDASGDITLPSGAKLTFRNAVEMARGLARTEDAQSCFARQWVRFALGRRESDADEASVATAVDAFTRSGFDVRELLVAIVKTKAFSHRTPTAAEVSP